ncbi:segregation/condensation protein A [Nanoarchaeota archaeon]
MDKIEGLDPQSNKMGHEEVYNLLVSRELSWQQMIYDLIKSEQLDPWNIDLSKLTQRYLEKVHEMEEANFIISSKILYAAALLLRIKSELLINRYIKSLDEILFGKPEKKEKPPIEINLDDVSELFPRSPLPRSKRVTLNELIGALNRAMTTEHRRIKNEVSVKHALNRFNFFLPKSSTDVRFKIKEVYDKVKGFFKTNANAEKMTYSELAPTKEEKRMSFAPVLHLDNQERILLEQLQHFDEIYLYLKNAGSSESLIKELKEKENKYREEKIKEQIEEEMRNKFEEIGKPSEEKVLTEEDF